ncbi:MAG: nucleotidyltransferase family protein [Firmicutes bacterium]|nr:nucleotidyltransferase family protein [Bacillota bacterium]
MLFGLVSEFNPFHLGHKYLIENLMHHFPDAKIICIMSGDYVMRGELAIYDKFTRARSAIDGGVDAVFELPAIFSLNNSEKFSYHAIRHLIELGINGIFFGAEHADRDLLISSAKYYQNLKDDTLNKKISFDKNISLNNFIRNSIHEKMGYMPGSNDMLALEYISKINEYDKDIKIFPIKRVVNSYNSNIDNGYSATAIRNNILKSDGLYNSNEKIFSLIKTVGITNFIETEGLSDEDINFIYNAIYNSTSYNELETLSTHKRLSSSRVKRAIIKSILNIDELEQKKYCNSLFIRPLAIKSNFKNILSNVDKDILIARYRDVENLSQSNREIYYKNEKFSNLYHSFYDQKKYTDRTSRIFIK